MKIVYYVHNLSFPLREGVRKQAWWLAQAMKNKGYDVSIVSTSGEKNKRTIIKDGIHIRYGDPFQIAAVDCDVLHYISHPSPLLVPLMIFSRAARHVMTMFDGNLNGFWGKPWYLFVGWLANKKLSAVTVQTSFQEVLLRQTRIKKPVISVIPPLIPSFVKNVRRHEIPTLLFMSHFHASKGIQEVLDAFEMIRKKQDVRLVVANSGMTSNPQIMKRIKSLSSVELKGVVDIQTELAQAWVYLYPVREAQETFSVPLSLIEAQQIGTPYIGTAVGGIGEYFERVHLVSPQDSAGLAAKIEQFLDTPVISEMKKPIVNREVIERFTSLYGGGA
jgi:glycosyltransferase involved in cell wall biosynthesis